MSTCIVITGMGRSGTSLVASLIQKAGVNIGRRLVGPGRANPNGFFEDTDFYQFQETLLLDRRSTILVPSGFSFEPTSAEIERAQALVAERQGLAVWGWKDPRTSLFLDLWDSLIPDARYLFVFRHPFEVLLSLLRAGMTGAGAMLEALEAWQTYNQRIIAFYSQHRDRCALCHTYALIAQPLRFRSLMEERLGFALPISEEMVESLYHSQELRRLSLNEDVSAILALAAPDIMRTYETLNATADLAFADPAGSSSATLPAIRALADSWPSPLSRAQSRSLLMALLAAIEPDALETYFSAFRAYVVESERMRFQDRGGWEKIAEDRAQQIDELVKGRDYHRQQEEQWRSEAQRWQTAVQEQQVELEDWRRNAAHAPRGYALWRRLMRCKR